MMYRMEQMIQPLSHTVITNWVVVIKPARMVSY